MANPFFVLFFGLKAPFLDSNAIDFEFRLKETSLLFLFRFHFELINLTFNDFWIF